MKIEFAEKFSTNSGVILWTPEMVYPAVQGQQGLVKGSTAISLSATSREGVISLTLAIKNTTSDHIKLINICSHVYKSSLKGPRFWSFWPAQCFQSLLGLKCQQIACHYRSRRRKSSQNQRIIWFISLRWIISRRKDSVVLWFGISPWTISRTNAARAPGPWWRLSLKA